MLVGGLGVGASVVQALESGVGRVDVVEVEALVVRWWERYFRAHWGLSGRDLDRLRVIRADVGEHLSTTQETYDAIVITALASQLAGTNDANVFKEYVNGVTFGGEKCTDIAGCLEIVNAGGNPDYDGVSGPLAFDGKLRGRFVFVRTRGAAEEVS